MAKAAVAGKGKKAERARASTGAAGKGSRRRRRPETMLLVGTRKGAFILRSDAERKKWKIDGPHFLGSLVHHLMHDPRDGETLLMAARTGHLGPTVFRSTDWGKTWKEAAAPPAFPKVP